MINEVKFSKYAETNQLVDSINLDDFIRRNLDKFLFGKNMNKN